MSNLLLNELTIQWPMNTEVGFQQLRETLGRLPLQTMALRTSLMLVTVHLARGMAMLRPSALMRLMPFAEEEGELSEHSRNSCLLMVT